MRAVILDRDNTILEDPGYLNSPESIRFLPGVIKGLRILVENGFKLFILTNQSGIKRGFLSLNRLKEIHRELLRRLESQGIKINGIYYCPHHPNERCGCRKPGIHLIKRLIDENPYIELERSFLVGDKNTDVELARRAHIKSILIGQFSIPEADYNAVNFLDAISKILMFL